MKIFEELKSSEEKRRELFCHFLICCIGVGVILHIVPYFYNPALWVDEAMVASSLCTRSLKNLVASPLDFGQSAAVGWLYIEKLLTVIFGESETVLRIFQLFASFGSMIFLYLIMKGRVKKHYALLVVAIFALTNRFIYYGNELKPYMFDNFCCLLLMYLWQKFKSGKLKILPFVIICAVMIWFSFPVVFFVASCMVIVCMSSLVRFIKTKETKNLLNIALCAVVLLSFVLNYLLWLSGTSDNAGGAGYWDNLKFPLPPKSLSDLIRLARMAWNFFNFYHDIIFVGVLAVLFGWWCAACIYSKRDESDILLPFVVSLLLMFGASSFGFYPIQDRLVQQWVIFVVAFAVFALDFIESAFETKSAFSWKINNVPYLSMIMIFLAFVGANGCKMLFARCVYNQTSEVKPAVNYLKANLTDDDAVYVFVNAIPAFLYYFRDMDIPVVHSHYERLEKDGKFILGNSYHKFLYKKAYSYDYVIDSNLLQNEVQRILKHDSVYIFNSHQVDKIPYLISELEKYGTVEIKNSFLQVNLYYFQKFKE